MHTDKVVWSEGMFLQPQHFQQQARHVDHLVNARAMATGPCGWGFTSLRIDESQLLLGKLAITAARGILPDGTPFDFPAADAAPLPLEIPADARNDTVLLGLPVRRSGALELAADSEVAELARYTIGEIDVADSTVPDRSAPVQVARMRLRLLLASQATDAYTCLRVARLVERRADNQVVLDRNFIAPTLAVRDSTLLAGYVRELHGLLHQRGETLAARLAQPGPGGVAEVSNFLWLQTVNRYEPVFGHLAELAQLHPERLFWTCLMLAGDLSTFSHDPRRPIAFPTYEHDDLEQTFRPLIADLRRSLSMEPDTSAVPIDLQDRKFGVRVAVVHDRTLLRTATLVLAVNAQMSPEQVRTRFPAQVKVGPVERIRDLVNLALPGIALNSLAVAPRQIPYHAGFNYFELDRHGELWAQLERSGGLAMHIGGDFPGLALELWAIKG